MLLVIDNGSIYTQNLINFLKEKKISFEKTSPNEIDLNSIENYESFILSGRRKNDKTINQINSKVILYCIKNDKKLLGICYGAEILALTLGGTIKKLRSNQKGEEEISIQRKNVLAHTKLRVFESHGFEISKLPNLLNPIGNSTNCKYEIIQYKGKLIFGTQFHPEMTLDGRELINKFCLL